MNVISFVAARLGEARHLFFSGVVLAATGIAFTATADLLTTAPGRLDQSDQLDLAPDASSNEPLLALQLECLTRGVITCPAMVKRPSLLEALGREINVPTGELQRLNPCVGTFLPMGTLLNVPACNALNAEFCNTPDNHSKSLKSHESPTSPDAD